MTGVIEEFFRILGGISVADPDLQIIVGGGHPDPEIGAGRGGGGGVIWNFFLPFWASLWSKNKDGPGFHHWISCISFQFLSVGKFNNYFCVWFDVKREDATRLRVVPHFSSWIVEWAKRECEWKSPHARNGDTQRGERKMFFTHARTSLALLSLRKNGGLLVV